MSSSIIPRTGNFDLTRPPGSLDEWSRKIITRLLNAITWGRIKLVHDDSITVFGKPETGDQPEVTLEVLHPRFYSDIVFGGSVGLAEAYIAGIWKCSDLTDLVRILVRNLSVLERAEHGPAWINLTIRKVFHLLHRNTQPGSRRNIVAHYDLGNEFYALFLDRTMTYSCGIFESESASLEEASIAKYDRICRKLHLGPEDHVIEIGGGWGGFAVYAADNFGCHVTTTTISENQYVYTTDMVRREGLIGRVEVLNMDYRDIDGRFDKLVSIEMIEAVGHEFLKTFFSNCSNLLKPDGMMALQAITIADQRYREHIRDVDFIKRYIFPGSCLTSVARICDVVTRATDLRLVHMEDITPHYARTLRCWRKKFLDRIDKVREMNLPESFIHMWEYYFCYCEGAFRERYIGNVQMIFSKPLCRQAPIPGDFQ